MKLLSLNCIANTMEFKEHRVKITMLKLFKKSIAYALVATVK